MSRVVLMCGPAGAGKSTVARRLEADDWVRLSVDVLAWETGHRRQPLADAVVASLQTELRRRLVELVQAGRDVVVDSSFWSRQSRDEYRVLLLPHGVVPEVWYLPTRARQSWHGPRGETVLGRTMSCCRRRWWNGTSTSSRYPRATKDRCG